MLYQEKLVEFFRLCCIFSGIFYLLTESLQGEAMFEKFRPLGSRVLIKRIEYQENAENSLIIVPDTAKEKAQTGQVISVGAGSLDKSGTLIPVNVKVGDIVYVGKYAGT